MLFTVCEIIAIFLLMLVGMGGGGLGNIVYFIDLPSLFLILVIIVPLIFANGLWKDFIRAFQMGNKSKKFTMTELKGSLEAVEFTQKTLIYTALMQGMFAVIVILTTCDSPEKLGPNIAVAALSILYVSILEIILLPLNVRIKKRIHNYMEE